MSAKMTARSLASNFGFVTVSTSSVTSWFRSLIFSVKGDALGNPSERREMIVSRSADNDQTGDNCARKVSTPKPGMFGPVKDCIELIDRCDLGGGWVRWRELSSVVVL